MKTNIAGANNAGRARDSRIRRGLWLLVLGVGVTLTCLHCYHVTEDFLSYPINTRVILDRKEQVYLLSVDNQV